MLAEDRVMTLKIMERDNMTEQDIRRWAKDEVASSTPQTGAI